MTTNYNCLLTCALAALISTSTVYAQSIEYRHDASVSGGYNSNVYRTQESSYVDWGQTTDPTITPNVQSGFFTDLDYQLEGAYALKKQTQLLGNLKVGGIFHLGSDLTNANETSYTLDFGAKQILSGKKRRVSTIEGIAMIDAVNKTYYDRDSGLQKTAGVTDLSDRYSYQGNGIQLKYKNSLDKVFQYGMDLAIGSRDYTDTTRTQMDYSYTALGADIEYQLQKSTTLSAGLEREVQDYDERQSRNLEGSFALTPLRNPTLEYTYLTLSFGIRHRLNDQWTLYGDYHNIERDDSWVNYNGYTAHKFKLRAIHKADNLRTRLSLSQQTRDYPNALAFDKPVNGVNVNKTYDTLYLSLSSELQQTAHRSLWGKITYNNTDTNDLRYDYSRFIIFAGYKWEY